MYNMPSMPFTHTHTHTHTRTCTHAHAHAHTRTHTHTHTHTHTRTCTHAHAYAHAHTRTHTTHTPGFPLAVMGSQHAVQGLEHDLQVGAYHAPTFSPKANLKCYWVTCLQCSLSYQMRTTLNPWSFTDNIRR